ncbi:MAG: DUF835 domain-containing protein [Candidatus Altiarchaeota archaeon]|nr:DUF835 domain-containing protein [Candidatus Altiarchaeota archaeon]
MPKKDKNRLMKGTTTVKEIMIKDVATISKEATVREAGTLMSSRDIGSLIVLDGGKPTGIITERDFLKKVIALGNDAEKLKVKDIMTSPIFTIPSSASVLDANKIFQKEDIRRLPVVEGGKMVGIVTQTDIVKALDSMVLNIVPSVEKQVKITKGKYELEGGFAYLVEEDKADRSLDMFVDAVLHGRHGLAITRMHPKKIREKYGLRKTPIVWLTNVNSDVESIYPTDLEQLSLVISKFVSKATNGIVYLEGIEYLVTNNSFNRLLHMIEFVRDKVSTTSSSLVISITPLSLDQKDLKLLEREMDHVETVEGCDVV